ncbi:MAG: ABC transporter permease [Solirubrobacterales bacterium]
MIIGILKQYKRNLLAVILLVIGYTLGIITLSVGISGINDTRNYLLDQTSGNPENIYSVTAISGEDSSFSFDNVNRIVSGISNDLEIQVGNFGKVNINGNYNNDALLVAIINQKKSDWHVPITNGKYFSVAQCKGNEKVAIIGKELEKKLFPSGMDKNSTIDIYGEKYNVIGIVGRENRETQWDYVVYIPFNTLPSYIKENFNVGVNKSSNLSLAVRKRSNENIDMKAVVEKHFKDILKNDESLNLNFDKVVGRDSDNSSLLNSIVGTVVISGIMLIMCIINVINLSIFWILSRKREISVRKALGATDYVIIKSEVAEMCGLAIISAFLAISIQSILLIFCNRYLINMGISIEVSLSNWLIVIFTSIICGVISSVKPVLETLKIQPAEALKS